MGDLLEAYLKGKARSDKFARPLKNAVGSFLGFTEDMKDYYFETPAGKSSDYMGFNIRQALIDFSESYAKPRYGEDIFGKLMVNRIKFSEPPITIITDCGFESEVRPVIDYVGAENVALFRMEREGFTFKGDSRGYLGLVDKNLAVNTTITNETPRDAFVKVINELKVFGW